MAANVDPLAETAPARGKTRYSDRAVTEVKATKVATKTVKAQEKAAAAPAPLTAEEKAKQQLENAPVGLNGDTGSKKKPKKVKGAPKERLQEQPPAPPAPKPDATPIPPKSVRDNGEPVVSPPPAVAPAAGTPPGAANPANPQ
jgi:peptidyl-prolyl cis-trans isomerase SurA